MGFLTKADAALQLSDLDIHSPQLIATRAHDYSRSCAPITLPGLIVVEVNQSLLWVVTLLRIHHRVGHSVPTM
jgi:hypothetical protein